MPDPAGGLPSPPARWTAAAPTTSHGAGVSTADQLLSARIATVCRRYCARSTVDDQDQAVAELQALAGDRPDLLAEHAGVRLGWAQVVTPAEVPGFRAEAEFVPNPRRRRGHDRTVDRRRPPASRGRTA